MPVRKTDQAGRSLLQEERPLRSLHHTPRFVRDPFGPCQRPGFPQPLAERERQRRNRPSGAASRSSRPTATIRRAAGSRHHGTYSGNVYLTGSITIYGHDKATDKPETQTLALTQGDFSPNPMNFPGQSQSGVNNPQVNSNFCEPVIDGYTYWVAASNQPGCTGGACILANSTVTVSVTGGSTQMFQLIMEMPLFNETTLGTTVHCAPTTAPCGLPLQGFYDFIFIIAIILAGGGLLIALANKQYTGRREEERRARFRHRGALHRPLPGNLQQHRPAHRTTST